MGAVLGLFVFSASRNKDEDATIEELLEGWDIQGHIEEIVEEEPMLEEKQDAQELLDLLYLDEEAASRAIAIDRERQDKLKV